MKNERNPSQKLIMVDSTSSHNKIQDDIISCGMIVWIVFDKKQQKWKWKKSLLEINNGW